MLYIWFEDKEWYEITKIDINLLINQWIEHNKNVISRLPLFYKIVIRFEHSLFVHAPHAAEKRNEINLFLVVDMDDFQYELAHYEHLILLLIFSWIFALWYSSYSFIHLFIQFMEIFHWNDWVLTSQTNIISPSPIIDFSL